MQLRKTCKSVGAVMLTLALLVGMMSVMGAFPAIAEETVKTWSFSDDWASVGGATDGTFNEANVSAVDAAFNVYSGCEDYFAKVDKTEFGTDTDGGNTWNGSETTLKTDATGLLLLNSVGSSYDNNTMRNYISLVPKTAEGDEIVVRNFRATFDLQNEITWGNGAFALQFGAQEPGRATEGGQYMPYGKRAAVFVSSEGVFIVDGKTVTVTNEVLSKKPFHTDNMIGGKAGTNLYERFRDGYNTGNGTTGGKVGSVLHVEVKVVNGQVTVQVTRGEEEEPFYTTSQTISWDRSGYVSFTGFMQKNIVSNMTLTALSDAGEPVDVVGDMDDEFTFKMDNVATVGEQTWPYDFSADANAAAIRDEIDAKFNTYYDWDATTTKLTKDTLGTNVSANTAIAKLTATGLFLNTVTGGYDGGGMRQSYSFALKNADGEEIVAKNFEMTFKATVQTAYSIGGLMLSFRAQESGKVAAGARWTARKVYNKRAAVYFGTYAAGVIDGSEADPEVNDTLYGTPEKAMTGYLADQVTGNGMNTSNPLSVYVRAVNGKVKLVVYNATTGTLMLDQTVDVTWNKEGTIYFSAMHGNQQFSDIVFNELDDNGCRIIPPPDLSYMDWTFEMDNSALGSFPYDFSADNETNNAIRDAIDAKFNVYAGDQAECNLVAKADLGLDNDGGDTWNSSVIQMMASANGIYMKTVTGDYSNGGGHALRNYMSLVPKTEAGAEIFTKNLEVEFDLNTKLSYSYGGGLMLMLRSQDSGRIAVSQTVPYAQRVGVLISSTGVKIFDGSDASVADNTMATAPFRDSTYFTAYTSGGNTNGEIGVHVYVKAVNDQLTVVVTKGGSTIYQSTTDITWNKAGTISFSGMAMYNAVSNITLKVLDDQGNQVPVDTVPFIDSFNDKVDNSDLPFEEGQTVYDFSEDNETNNAVRDAVNAKWNVYGSLDNIVHQFAPAEIGSQHDSLLSTQNPTEVWLGATANGYNLCAKSDSYADQTMRVSLSLVPKNAAGNEIVTKNFEVSFKLKTQLSWSHGGFMVKFREQTPGYTAYNGGDSETLKPYTQNVALFLSAYGAGIWDGAEDSEVNASKWKKPVADATLVTPYTSGGTDNGTKELDVTLRAVGSTVTAKVAIAGAVVYEETKEVTWLKAGMLSFTGLYGDNVLSNVSLTLLDDNGEPVIPYTEKLEGGAVAVESMNKKGSVTDTQFFTTVAPEAGKQLKAGSLRARVKGSDGDYTIMPSRVGFRDAANLQSAQFVFDSAEDLEFTAEFYTPASTAEANVAMLATSKSTTETGGSYGNAVRFISRSYIYADGGKFYMDINGAPMEVADFGMYVTSQAALDKAGYESMEDAIAEGTLRALVKRSIPAAGQEVGKLGIFYDYADGYVDTSIQIINIPSTHLEQKIVSCTYVEFANGDVFLTAAASRSHADA